MIVDLSSRLKERDAVAALSVCWRRGGDGGGAAIHIVTHTHTGSLIGREMQSGALYRG